MQRNIILQDQEIHYTVRTNARSRNLRMVIDPDQGLIVTIPNAWHDKFIEPFLLQKSSWILKHLAHAKKQLEEKIVIQFPKEEYEYNKNTVRKMVTERVEFFNSFYKFPYNNIRIRNQTSVWGSCSRSGNLQFNYRPKRRFQQSNAFTKKAKKGRKKTKKGRKNKEIPSPA